MTTGTQSQARTEEERVRRAHLLVGGVTLAACAVAYLAVVADTAGTLPERLATHVGIGGGADGWMDRTLALVSFGAFAVALPALLLGVFAAGQWWLGSSARMVTALIGGTAAGLVALFATLLWAQRGPEDATQLRLEAWTMLWPLVVGLGVGVVTTLVLPPNLPQPDPVPVDALPIRPSDRVSWFGHARSSQTLAWGLLAGVGAVVLAILVSGVWWLWLLAILMLLLYPATATFRVTIDRSGLTWRSALGVPRGQVPLESITGVAIVDVRPGDFGGYGVRSTRGATGVITRPGPALQVQLDGRRFVITVDDPATGASTLEGLRQRV